MVGAASAAGQFTVRRLHEERRPRRAFQPLAKACGLRTGVPLLHQVERPQSCEMVVGHRVVRVAVHPGRREVFGLACERRLESMLRSGHTPPAPEVLARRRHEVPVVQRPPGSRLVHVHLLRNDGGQVALPAGRYRCRHQRPEHDVGVDQQDGEEIGVTVGGLATRQVRAGGLHRADASRQEAAIPVRRTQDGRRQREGRRGVLALPLLVRIDDSTPLVLERGEEGRDAVDEPDVFVAGETGRSRSGRRARQTGEEVGHQRRRRERLAAVGPRPRRRGRHAHGPEELAPRPLHGH